MFHCFHLAQAFQSGGQWTFCFAINKIQKLVNWSTGLMVPPSKGNISPEKICDGDLADPNAVQWCGNPPFPIYIFLRGNILPYSHLWGATNRPNISICHPQVFWFISSFQPRILSFPCYIVRRSWVCSGWACCRPACCGNRAQCCPRWAIAAN